MNISCFIAGAEASDLKQTIEELKQSGLVQEVFVVSESAPNIPGIGWIESATFNSTKAIRAIAEKASGDFSLFYTKSLPLKIYS